MTPLTIVVLLTLTIIGGSVLLVMFHGAYKEAQVGTMRYALDQLRKE